MREPEERAISPNKTRQREHLVGCMFRDKANGENKCDVNSHVQYIKKE